MQYRKFTNKFNDDPVMDWAYDKPNYQLLLVLTDNYRGYYFYGCLGRKPHVNYDTVPSIMYTSPEVA